MAQSLNTRIGTWAKSGAAFAKNGLALMVEATDVALDNGNIDPIKRIIASLDERDGKHALVIFKAHIPLTVGKDQNLTMKKGWKDKAKALPYIHTGAEKHVSFRTFADELAGAEPKADTVFGLEQYLKSIEKLNKKGADGEGCSRM